MPLFQVTVTYKHSTSGTREIEAASVDEALEKAEVLYAGGKLSFFEMLCESEPEYVAVPLA